MPAPPMLGLLRASAPAPARTRRQAFSTWLSASRVLPSWLWLEASQSRAPQQLRAVERDAGVEERLLVVLASARSAGRCCRPRARQLAGSALRSRISRRRGSSLVAAAELDGHRGEVAERRGPPAGRRRAPRASASAWSKIGRRPPRGGPSSTACVAAAPQLLELQQPLPASSLMKLLPSPHSSASSFGLCAVLWARLNAMKSSTSRWASSGRVLNSWTSWTSRGRDRLLGDAFEELADAHLELGEDAEEGVQADPVLALLHAREVGLLDAEAAGQLHLGQLVLLAELPDLAPDQLDLADLLDSQWPWRVAWKMPLVEWPMSGSHFLAGR